MIEKIMIQRIRNLNKGGSGGQGTRGSHQQVPDARKAKGSQGPIGMRLAEMPNKVDGEPVKNISNC